MFVFLIKRGFDRGGKRECFTFDRAGFEEVANFDRVPNLGIEGC